MVGVAALHRRRWIAPELRSVHGGLLAISLAQLIHLTAHLGEMVVHGIQHGWQDLIAVEVNVRPLQLALLQQRLNRLAFGAHLIDHSRETRVHALRDRHDGMTLDMLELVGHYPSPPVCATAPRPSLMPALPIGKQPPEAL